MMQNRIAREMWMAAAALGLCVALSGIAAAAEAPGDATPSRHQLMKDCMAKQKAAHSGLPKEDMKNACKDVTKTEKQNDVAAEKAADKPKPPAN
jgi:hypothetical protein